MTIADRAVLVTGANRGIGQALVEEALRRGAKRVYAGTRQPLAHPDGRVTPLRLDVTNPAQIQAAADQVETLDLLINNAGVPLRRPERSCRAGTPPGRQPLRHLRRDPGLPAAAGPFSGAIVNDLSIMALAPLPLTPAYSISKAAAFSLTQSLRALLAGRGVRVHAVLTGPTDTDMVRDLDIPKTSPEADSPAARHAGSGDHLATAGAWNALGQGARTR
jgi:NAD(P)-dependent dehydrogenase (short-subunit alcohol dehydrogenase family)